MITVAFGFASAFVPGITNLSNNCRTITAGNTILLSPVSRRRDDNTRRKIVAVLFLRPREGPLPALRGECQGLGHVSQRHPTRAGKDVNGPAKSEKQGDDSDERRPKSHRQAKGNPESLDERIDQSQCAEIQDEEHGSLSIHASEGKDQPTQIDILPPILWIQIGFVLCCVELQSDSSRSVFCGLRRYAATGQRAKRCHGHHCFHH